MLTTIAILIGIIGAGLLWRGLGAGRVGDTPFCRPCGYNLTGLTSDRCPECGRLMTDDNIVRGTRRRRPVLTSAAALLLGVSTSPMIVHWLNVDFTRYKPTILLISELRSPKVIVARKAITELDRRFLAGKLSQASQTRLIDFCLKQQAVNPASAIHQELMNHLGSAYAAGLLSASQKNLMFSQLARFEFKVRPKGVVGDRLPFEIICHAHCPILPNNRNFDLEIKQLDSEIETGLRSQLGGSMTMGTGGGFMRGITGTTLDTQSWPAGKHTLTVRARFSVPASSSQGSAAGPNGQPPLYQQNLAFAAPVELLAAEPPGGLVRGVRDDALKKALNDCIRVRDLRYANGYLQGVIDLDQRIAGRNPRSIGLTCDVIVRIASREIPLETTFTNSLKPTTSESRGFHSSHGVKLPPATTCDLILRSSPKAARNTIDLYEYWDGELVFPNLSITGAEAIKPAGSQPTSTSTRR